MKVFQERIKELRLDKKLSAKQLGEILHINSSIIIKWENGDMLPTIDKLYLMATYFNVSSDFLLGIEDF